VARTRKPKGNSEIAAQLQSWAITYGVSDDAYVSELLNAIESGEDLEYWSRYDNTEILPRPANNAGQSQFKISETLISFRNIMVFVPVAFTWAGISQATTAFSKYTSSNSSKIVNFFDFWENGYGVLNRFWTLSNIARVDFFLLSIVILASTFISILQTQVRKNRGIQVEKVESDRIRVALILNRYLYQFRNPTPEIISQRISQAIRNLSTTSKDLARASKSIEKNARFISNTSPVRSQLESIKKLLGKLQK